LLANPDFNTRIARTNNRHRLITELNARTSRFTKAQLTERLGGKIPFGPVMDIAEIMVDPHFAARQMIVDVEQPGAAPIQIAGVPIKMTETPGGVMRRSPLLGEDTAALLSGLGLSEDEIQTLVDQRIVVAANQK
jgi:crotonobetainyl-CoA:carnitine CoA-transferase CaiB-like acyl-CoA transferase